MNESILTTIKKMLGIMEEYTHFDQDILIHINSAFMSLRQIGVGPTEGFYVDDTSCLWSDFVDDMTKYAAVRTYIYLKVRLIFDPPTNSTHLQQLKDELTEVTWRLNHETEK